MEDFGTKQALVEAHLPDGILVRTKGETTAGLKAGTYLVKTAAEIPSPNGTTQFSIANGNVVELLDVEQRATTSTGAQTLSAALDDRWINPGTTSELIATTKFAGAATGTIVKTDGFTSSGDGGCVQWRKTGVSGLTASQTPAQLATGKLHDAGGNEWEVVSPGVLWPEALGAAGDGTTDDKLALQALLNYATNIYLPGRTYRSSGTLTKTGQLWQIHGSGIQNSILQFDVTATDNLHIGDGASMSRIALSNFGVITSSGDKTAGASIAFDGHLINSEVTNIYVRHFWDAFSFTGTTKSYFTNITYDQFTRTAGTRGRYGFNCQVRDNRMVDWHLTNIQGSGFVSGATPESSIDAHFFIVGADGIYLQNSHFFYSDRVLRIQPSNVGEGVTISSIFCTQVYFDTTEINHVYFVGEASTAYQSIQFSNCLFRATQTGHSTQFAQTGNVDVVKYSNCVWRDNFKSGISATDATNKATNLSVTGGTFDGNNIENAAVQGDIITRGDDGVFTGNTHIGGGAAGHALRFLSGATGNTVTGGSVSQSTATDVINDGGTDTEIANVTGYKLDNYGTSSITTDASGEATIAHGLAVTPTWVNAERHVDSDVEATVVGKDATNITVRLRNSSTNADVPSFGPVDVTWAARG